MKSIDFLTGPNRGYTLIALALLCTGLWTQVPARAEERDVVSVNVLVKEAESDKPISFARLTLQYREDPGKFRFKRGKLVSLNAKTNLQGRYKFVNIPMGTIRLMVNADRRQTYGQEIEIVEDNQLIEVKLRKPQPLL